MNILTFNSVRSRANKPKFNPENNAEKHKQRIIMIIATQTGTRASLLIIRNQASVPW